MQIPPIPLFLLKKAIRFLPIVFAVWLRDGATVGGVARVICGDSEEVSSEPPRARAPPDNTSREERGFRLILCTSSSPAKGSGE